MESKLRGKRDGGSGEEVDIKATRHGSVLASQYLPYGAALTAKGDSWQVMATSAIAALVVRPTDTAMLTLWNGEAAGGKSYIIERVFTHALVTGTQQDMFGIWLCLNDIGMSTVDADITAICSNRAVANYGGNALVDVGATVTDIAGWFPWGPSGEVEATGVLPGSIACAEVNGRIIVPPSAGLSITVVAGTVDVDCCCGFHWYEEVIDLA